MRNHPSLVYSSRTGVMLSLLFLLFHVPNVAQASRSTISGYVFDEHRRPVQQIPVELLSEYNSVLRRLKTDGSGRFLFSGLGQGRFSIRVLPLGTNLEEKTEEVEIYGIGAQGRALSDNIQRDIYLRTRRSDAVVSASPGSIFAQEVPDSAQREYKNAISDLENKRDDEAATRLRAAIAIFPDYFQALDKLGFLYVSQGKYQEGMDVYSRAVAVNERSFNGWYGLAYANYSLHRPSVAIEASRKAVSLNPNSGEASLLLGLSFRMSGQYLEAEKSLKKADKLLKSESADVHWNLALLYAHDLKRFSEAADELESYLKVRPDSFNKEQVRRLIQKFRDKPQSSTSN